MAISISITPPVTGNDIVEAFGLIVGLANNAGIELDGPHAKAAMAQAIPQVDPAVDVNVTADPEEPEGPPAVEGTLAKSTSGAMIPWDERIHSKGKSVNADGSWRLKRGVDDSVVKQIEAELSAPTLTEAPGVQSESKSESTPPPGAAEAMLATPPAPAPAPAAPAAPAQSMADFNYKHGDQVFTYEQLKSAQWTDEQIKCLERVPAAAPAQVASESAAPAKALTFADVALQVNAKGLSWDTVNAEIVKIATAKGKPHVAQFALLAIPENADILADLAAAIL